MNTHSFTRPARLYAGIVVLAVLVACAMAAGIPARAQQPEPILNLGFDESVDAGGRLALAAYLTDPAGNPIYDAEINFSLEVEFMNVSDSIELGSAITDDSGLALIEIRPRIEGTNIIKAEYAGSEVFAPAFDSGDLEVVSAGQLYREYKPYRIPGANIWLTTGLITTVWIIFIVCLGYIGWVNWQTRKERESSNV